MLMFSEKLMLRRERDDSGEVEADLLTSMRDAQAASRAKSKFLATMSHELRTPLSAIIGFSEIMESELFGPLGSPQYTDYARHIRECGRYLLELTDDILDLAKIEAGRLEVNLERVDLRDIAESCLQMVKPQAHEARLTVELNVVGNIPPARADARRLRQIILNLLSNAIKFTQGGEGIRVDIVRDDAANRVSLRVADTGVGIAHADIARVMRPFERVENTLGKARPGTGLGLPLTKSLVELLGGTFEIQSAIGVGTTVTVGFPVDRS
jgi:signal transduction histidine kinase